jgi:uncharacterized protein (TIGR03435 family)
MRHAVLTIALLTVPTAAGQTPSFEAASVKPAPPPAGRAMLIHMGGDPGRVSYQNVTLKQLLTKAYGVKEYQVSGPAWIDTERYDVTATMPEKTPKESVERMLQNLLAERFQLKLHRESKEAPVYALVVAKGGPKLKKSEMAAVPAGSAGGGPGRGIRMGPGKLEGNGMDMGFFTDVLSTLVGRPVLDRTELKDAYDCTLEFTPDATLSVAMMKMSMARPEGAPEGAAPESSGPSIFTAVQEQLGLKLESRKAPLDLIVVDGAEKVPTEN